MPDTATVIGPVVRMCTDPDCHGSASCPSSTRDRGKITDRTLGVSEVINLRGGLSDEAVCARLASTLAWGYSPDSRGRRRMIPDGCEFAVHKGTAGHPAANLVLPGQEWYAAVYSGPATCIDDILGDAPEYDRNAAVERLRRMGTSGD